MALAQPWTTFASYISSDSATQDRIEDFLEQLLLDSEIALGDGSDYNDFGRLLDKVKPADVSQFFQNSTGNQFEYFKQDIAVDLETQIHTVASNIFLRETNIDTATENNLDAWNSFFNSFPADISQGIEEFIKSLRSPEGSNPTVIQIKDLSDVEGAGAINVKNEILALDDTHLLIVQLAERFINQANAFYQTILSNFEFGVYIEYADTNNRLPGEKIDVEIENLKIDGDFGLTAIQFPLGTFETNENGFFKFRFQIVQENKDHYPSEVKLKFTDNASSLTLSPSTIDVPTSLSGTAGSQDGPKETRVFTVGNEPSGEETTRQLSNLVSGLTALNSNVTAITSFVDDLSETDNGFDNIISNLTYANCTLENIRRIGGFQNTLEFESEDETTKGNLRTIDRHAFLEGMGVGQAMSEELDSGDTGMSLADIAKEPRSRMVGKLKTVTGENDFSAFTKNDGVTAAINYATSFVAQFMAEDAMGTPAPDNGASSSSSTNTTTYNRIKTLLTRVYKQKCACNDCETAVSPLAYLLDLIHYTVSFVEDNGSKLSLSDLSSTFFQDFEELPAACDMVEESVSQARMSAESLHYRVGDPDNTDIDSYLTEVYEGLLRLLGTNTVQLQDAISNEAKKKSLCERLGLKYDLSFDIISKLNLQLAPNGSGEFELTEDNLEKLTGLRSIRADRFSIGYKSGDTGDKIAHWKFDKLRYGLNTNATGTVKLSVAYANPTRTVQIKLDDDTIVGSGSIDQETGNVAIKPEGINGISGVVQISGVTAAVDAVTIQVIPEILAAQLSNIRSQWLDSDSNEGHIIDPDVLFPQDFRDPFDTTADSAMQLWVDRKDDLASIKSAMVETEPGHKSDLFQFKSKQPDGTIVNETAPSFLTPLSMTADFEGNVYIADKTKIYRIDKNKLNLPTWDSTSLAESDFVQLIKVDYSRAFDLVCVANQEDGNHSIQMFDRDGNLKIKLVLTGTAEGQIGNPKGATIMADGSMLIVDEGAVQGEGSDVFRAQKAKRPSGVLFPEVPGLGIEPFDGFRGVDDFEGHEVAACAMNYSKDYSGEPYAFGFKSGQNFPLLQYLDPDGNPASFSDPVDVSFHHSGMLFLLDKGAKRVIFFSTEFEPVGSYNLPDVSRTPIAIGVSKKTTESFFYVVYEGLSSIDRFTFEISSDLTVTTETTDHLDTDESSNEDIVVDENGDVFVVTPTKIKKFESGSTTAIDYYTSSQTDLKSLNIRYSPDNQFDGLIIGSGSSVIEILNNDGSNLGEKIGELTGKNNSWMDLSNLGGLGSSRNGDILMSSSNTELMKFHAPSFFWHKSGEVLNDLYLSSGEEERLYVGTDTNAYRLDPKTAEVLFDFQNDNTGVPVDFDVRSVSEDEHHNLMVFTRKDAFTSYLQRFNNEGIFLESVRMDAATSAPWTQIPRGNNYISLPGRRGLVAAFINEGHADNKLYEIDLRTGLSELLSTFGTEITDQGEDRLDEILFDYDDFLLLDRNEKNGISIEEDLSGYFMTYSEYRFLQNIVQRELGNDGFPSGVDWWDQAKDILLNVYKKAKSSDWATEESNQRIHIGPDHFNLIDRSSENALSFNQWRASITDRIDFRNTLESRTTQESGLYAANKSLVEDLEKDHMPSLRDIYIEADSKTSLELENELLMDMHSTGEVRSNRITQAMTTLQGFLWGVKNEVYEGDVSSDYVLNSDHFNEEWQWLGSYASWRSAMMVFLYPENLLAPQYKKLFSPGFRELTVNVLNSRRFDMKDACAAAESMEEYFKEIQELDPRGGVLEYVSWFEEKAGCEKVEKKDFRVVTLGKGKKGDYYYSLQHPTKVKIDALSTWKKLPEITAGHVLAGTVTVEVPEKKIMYVFHPTDKRDELKGLYFNTKDLTWDSDFVEIPEIKFESKRSKYGKVTNNKGNSTSLFKGFYEDSFEATETHVTNTETGEKIFFTIRSHQMSGDYFILKHGANGPFWKTIKTKSRKIIFAIPEEESQNTYQPFHIFYHEDHDEYYVVSSNGKRLIIDSPSSIYGYVKDIAFEGSLLGFSFLDDNRFFLPFWTKATINNEERTIIQPLYFDIVAKNNIDETKPAISNQMPDFLWWFHSVINTSFVTGFSNRFVIYHHGQTKLAEINETSDVISYPVSRYITPYRAKMELVDNPLTGKSQPSLEQYKKRDAFGKFYTDEAYLFFPLLMAEKLRERGHYEDSLKWYAQVYDHNAALEARGQFVGLKLQNADSVYAKDESWLNDPLDPHGLAKKRNRSYEKYLVNGIARCLISYADSEFGKDTAESVPKARELYKEALETLGTIMDVDPESNCASILQGISITAPSNFPQWQSLIDQGISYLGLVKDKDQLQSFVDDEITNTGGHEDDIEGSATESALQTNVKNFLEAVLDEVHGQNGILEFNFLEMYGKSNESLEAMLTAAVTAIDAETGGNGMSTQAIQNAQNALQNSIGTPEDYTDGTTSGTSTWLNATTLGRVSNPNFEGSVLNLAEDSIIDADYYAGVVAVPNDAGEPVDQTPVINDPVHVTTQNAGNGASGFQPTAGFVFCIPRNPLSDLLALKAQLNLAKIYTSRNISGQERQIEPFSAPIDATSGLALPGINSNGGTDINDLGVLPGIHRFSTLIAKAKEQANYAIQMENSFLSLLEKYDAESFSLLQAEQNLNLSSENIRLQDIRLKEANQGFGLSILQLERSQISEEHFTGLIDRGLLEMEHDTLQNLRDAQKFTGLAAGYMGASAIMSGAAQAAGVISGAIGFDKFNPLTWIGAGLHVAAGISASIGIGHGATASQRQIESSILSQRASFKRRREDWEYQQRLANQDIKIGEKNINIAETRVHISSQEKHIAELQRQHAKESLDFLKTKFTSVELYAWMAEVMEGVYSYFLAQATSTAHLAYAQLGFERQQLPSTVIRSDYWDEGSDGSGLTSGLQTEGGSVDRRGLTGSARLLQDITQLEQEAIETDQRKLQISKTISVANLDPGSFYEFKESGVLNFNTPMSLFDRDFPGHYLRLVKKVSVSVVALVPTADGIKASLSNVGPSRVVKGEINPQKVDVNRLNESISFSNPIGANGLFELQADNSKLNPFEGMGVDSTWRLEMQKAANLIDYNAIADVLLTIDYTALENPNYKQIVSKDLGTDFEGERPFGFKSHFPDQWFDLNNADQFATGDKFKVKLEFSPLDFPGNLSDIRLDQVLLAFDIEDQENDPLNISVKINEDICTSVDGRISTTNSTGANWLSHMVPLGTGLVWNLEITGIRDSNDLDLTEAQMESVIKERINNMFLSLSYKGTTPAWAV